MIEMPDPYRTDWRFAYLTATLINLFSGKGKSKTVGEIYNDMKRLYCVLPEEIVEDSPESMKAKLRMCFPSVK